MSDTSNNTAARAMTMSGKPSGFRSLLGYRAIRWERDYAEIELALGAKHMNSLGFTHGGLYLTLIDAAFGHVAGRRDPVETYHFGVNSLVQNATFALYRDFPDPERHRGEERF